MIKTNNSTKEITKRRDINYYEMRLNGIINLASKEEYDLLRNNFKKINGLVISYDFYFKNNPKYNFLLSELVKSTINSLN
jgi:hypothetical protein